MEAETVAVVEDFLMFLVDGRHDSELQNVSRWLLTLTKKYDVATFDLKEEEFKVFFDEMNKTIESWYDLVWCFCIVKKTVLANKKYANSMKYYLQVLLNNSKWFRNENGFSSMWENFILNPYACASCTIPFQSMNFDCKPCGHAFHKTCIMRECELCETSKQQLLRDVLERNLTVYSCILTELFMYYFSQFANLTYKNTALEIIELDNIEEELQNMFQNNISFLTILKTCVYYIKYKPQDMELVYNILCNMYTEDLKLDLVKYWNEKFVAEYDILLKVGT